MPTSTPSRRARDREARYLAALDSAIRTLARFATAAEAHRAPVRLIAPVSRSAWLAMDEDARRALIAENVSAEHRARFEEGERLRAEQRAIAARNAEAKAERRVAEAERQARANDETATRRPAPHASAAPTRWLVSCAHGCGAMLPTSGPRPIVRWCSIGAAEHAVGSRA